MVGAGAFGRFCIDAYGRSEELRVLSVADPDPGALAQADAPGARLETNWRSVLADDAVEVVHLATPPFERWQMALAAFDAGKSVFCEKPLALSLAEADAMIAAARRAGLALSVDYVMRHHPAYRALDSLAASGQFGRLRSLALQNYAQAVPPGHWFWDRSRSGGILVEHGVHFFDAYGRLAGEPSRLWGSRPTPEAVDVTVQYRSGAVGRFYHEFAFPPEVERAEGIVFFERGYVEIEGWIPVRLHGAVLAPIETIQAAFDDLHLPVWIEGGEAVRFETQFGDREEAYRDAIVAGMRDVAQKHRDPSHPMRVSPEDARASLALALRAEEAARSAIAEKLPNEHPAHVAPVRS
jgi:predicted dehydrogenase